MQRYLAIERDDRAALDAAGSTALGHGLAAGVFKKTLDARTE